VRFWKSLTNGCSSRVGRNLAKKPAAQAMVDILAAWKVDLVFGMPGAHINALYPGKVITELERVHRRRTKVAFYPHTPLMIGD
jgi:hypothetical protein